MKSEGMYKVYVVWSIQMFGGGNLQKFKIEVNKQIDSQN